MVRASGGGVYNEHQTTIANSIIAGNHDDDDVRSRFVDFDSRGHNLIGYPRGALGFSSRLGDLIGFSDAPLDPRLGPLADNGGPTKTHALLPGSPAIDHGDFRLAVDQFETPLFFDQRGFSRSAGVSVDIGAYEFGSTRPVLSALVGVINNEAKSGRISQEQALGLLDLLHLDDKDHKAAQQVEHFIREVERMVQKGSLPEKSAKPILAAANTLLKSLLGDPFTPPNEQ